MNTRAATKSESPNVLSQADMASIRLMMQELVRDELTPINQTMVTLSTQVTEFQASLQNVNEIAESAVNKANEVDNKVDMANKRVSALETALLRSQNEQKKTPRQNPTA